MLAKLKNNGDGLRILFDVHHQQRQIRPGYELTVDLDPKVINRYQRAEEAGDTLTVELIDDADEVELAGAGSDAGRRTAHTLRDGEGLDGQGTGGGTIPQTMQGEQGQTLREATGHSGMPQRSHGDEENDPAANKTEGPAVDDGNTKSVEPDKSKAKPTDRIAQNAKHKAKPQKPVPAPAPVTASSLLKSRTEYNPEQLLIAANKVLPKGALPRNPRPSQIISALQRQAASDNDGTQDGKGKDTKIKAS